MDSASRFNSSCECLGSLMSILAVIHGFPIASVDADAPNGVGFIQSKERA
jgi:hypothetical protein